MNRTRLLLPVALVALVLGAPLVLPAPRTADTSSHRELAGDDSRFVRILGTEVHHTVHGPDDAPTVLLSHHFYGSVPTWRHVVADLADDHRVVAFDRPGFGLTERLPRDRWVDGVSPYTRDAAARMGWGLLDHLDVRDAVLVGSSAGGTNVLEMYARQPDRVRALVLVSPAITGDVGAPEQLRPVLRSPQARGIGPHVVRRLAGEVTAERVGSSWYDPSRVGPEDVDAYTRLFDVDGWATGLYEVMTAEAPPALAPLLPTISVPTLVVSGDTDRVITSRWNRHTAAAIPGARFEELERCGHTPQEECPDALLAVVRDFLDDLP